MGRLRTAVAVALVTAVVAVGAHPAAADGYDDPDYRAHDLDDIARTFGRQQAQLTDPAGLVQLGRAGAETELANLGRQAADLQNGRLYLGLGQLLPGGDVGRAAEFHAIEPARVAFLTRTGAKLQGRLFWDGAPGPHPMIEITSGSIQGPQSGYWWAAQLLAANGYLVMTWDAQGQGESEVFGHAAGDVAPTFDGVPFQDAANFVDGTVDAIRFFLSTPDRPYRPDTWTPEQTAAATAASAAAGEALDWYNPLWGVADRTRLGLAGHSLGASAVSIVAQCSDESDRWRSVDACPDDGPLPIRAVVGWDRLSAGGDVVPVVPGMDQQADGYFLNPQPRFEPVDPLAHLATFDEYVAAGVDSYAVTIRGGTHLEWSYIPLILPATGYGIDAAGYYTLAWFDRYVHPSGARRRTATTALVTGPVPDGLTGGADELPWRANFLSANSVSAYRFHGSRRFFVSPLFEATDLRATSGLSPVGDWRGANADHPAVRRP